MNAINPKRMRLDKADMIARRPCPALTSILIDPDERTILGPDTGRRKVRIVIVELASLMALAFELWVFLWIFS